MSQKVLNLSIILIIFSLFFIIPEEKNIPTFNEIEDNNVYKLYEITFDDLTTKNFSDYFNEELKILTIYPYINPIYKNSVPKLYSYTFTDNNITKNIKKFTEYYIDNIANYYNEKDNFLINGIKIDKVKVYTTYNTINENFDLSKVKIKNI